MRLDKYLALNGFSSRTKAARAISEGRVKVNGKCVSASAEIREGDLVEVQKEEVSFVSEGGFKLYKALSEFGESVEGFVFADIGASTGGFTDCLLQGGARRVYAVDVGESQLEGALAADARVRVMDNVNARYLKKEDFPEEIGGITADVSFISLTLILPAVADILSEKGKAFLLVKPQFECGRAALDKHGIVKDEKERCKALLAVCFAAEENGLYVKKITNAPLKARKNVEYVVLFEKDKRGALTPDKIGELARTLT